MSCDWDVYCADCDKELGIPDVNSLEVIKQIIAARTHLAGLAKAAVSVQAGPVKVVWGWGWLHFSIDFFLEHDDHILAPRDEYGRVLKETGGVQ